MQDPANPPTDAACVADSGAAWRRFWATGVVDTFGSPLAALKADPGPASPPLVGVWRRWMEGLPTHGELLDLGCGNGAVLCHLLIAKPDATVRGLGVDLAVPTAAWMEAFPPAQRQRVECRGGIAAEALPFEDGRFDGCSSQFGIEYADLGMAVPEAVRVLRPGARLGWALHHAEGRPARLAREELGHLDWLDASGWLAAADQLVASAELAARRSDEALRALQAARQRVERLLAELKERSAASICPDVLADTATWTHQCFELAHRRGAPTGHAALRRIDGLLQDTRSRLRDLVTHTLGQAQWQSLLGLLRAHGVVLGADTGPLWDRGHLMGWWVDGHRGAPSDGRSDVAQ